MRRDVALVALLAVCSCSSPECDLPTSKAPPAMLAQRRFHRRQALPPTQPGPSIQVAGLDELAHRPLVRLLRNAQPMFVLYDDGLVIYGRPPLHREMLRAEIGPTAAAELAGELVRGGFFDLPSGTGQLCPGSRDQPVFVLLVRDETRWHEASVEGLTWLGTPDCLDGPWFGEWTPGRGPHQGEGLAAPAAFVSAFRRIDAFEAANAATWKPEQIEIELVGFEYARYEVPWPEDVPAPPAIATPRAGVRYIIDGRYGSAAHATWERLGGTTAVRAHGSKWGFYARDVVPEEPYLEKVAEALR